MTRFVKSMLFLTILLGGTIGGGLSAYACSSGSGDSLNAQITNNTGGLVGLSQVSTQYDYSTSGWVTVKGIRIPVITSGRTGSVSICPKQCTGNCPLRTGTVTILLGTGGPDNTPFVTIAMENNGDGKFSCKYSGTAINYTTCQTRYGEK